MTAHQIRSRATILMTILAVIMASFIVPATSTPASADEAVPNVLVYSAAQAYRHGSIDYGNPIIQQLADETGAFTVDFTEDPTDIVPSNLANYDIVLFNSPSGTRWNYITDSPGVCSNAYVGDATCDHAPFTKEQRQGFIEWVECGGGVAGVHQVHDAWHDWDEWDELVGLIFSSHYSNAEANMVVLSDHPVAAPFGDGEGETNIGDTFVHADEFYDFAPGNGPVDLSSDVVPLIGIRDFTDAGIEASQGDHYDDEQAMAWLSSYRGSNRVFMTNLGHNTATWDKPAFREHLVEGITYVAGQRPDADCVATIADPPLLLPYLGCFGFFFYVCPFITPGL